MRRFPIAIALILSACSAAPNPVDNQQSANNQAAASDDARAAFPISRDDLMVGVVGMDGPWRGKPSHQSTNRDDLTGGESSMLVYPNGAIDIFTMPDGKVWRVRLVAGQGDRCGRAADLDAGVASIRQMLQATPSRTTRADGCVRIATITA
ncbi:hypothetical protein [Sphingomonas paucimobilis]|uniref:Lipoprotein n=1 Tax=Sphingomonas paucimobilis TaxID=13689 RepID=A0A7T3A9D9_SPHPI|nr:hypothetical protein [Sphingomonas paucimobilis]QPT08618.1 hypothetical protein I6G38_18175 [Sphingomonas paucimobilis]